jgi:DNA-binding MarR family transcriptional regulator
MDVGECLMDMPSDDVVRAWVRLVRAHGVVEGALKAAGLPALEWYDVLLELERHGAQRPRDLQGRLLMAQYNLSRLLDRMVAAGLVERGPCVDDGRGQVVGVTAAGLAMRGRMWPVYAAAIEDAVGAQLEAGEAAMLARLLGRVAKGVEMET